MSTPKVSILLPNRNNRPYLDERLHSIAVQTLPDWELIVVDTDSDDGAWELFVSSAERDPRVRLHRSSQRGIFNNLNTAVRLARGEYVYVATSDDSMAPTTLERLSRALDENPDCDIAHCKLRIVNDAGAVSTRKVWERFPVVRYFGELIDRPHVRLAPHDGVLHFAGMTVYTSLTQLLVRRSLFDTTGLFEPEYGSIADFEWGMRVTLVANTVHVPEHLATWRLHDAQASSDEGANRARARGLFLEMAHRAVSSAERLRPDLLSGFKAGQMSRILKRDLIHHRVREHSSRLGRALATLRCMSISPAVVTAAILQRLAGSAPRAQHEEMALEYVRGLIHRLGLERSLRPLDVSPLPPRSSRRREEST